MPKKPNPSPMPPMQDPLLARVPAIEGYKVLGKVVLLERVGAGGMGVVYRGWHMTFRIDVAVKVLKPSLADDRSFVVRFRDEAQAALKITHQNVVRAYDVEERHGLHFLVMEFVDGESAWQRVGRAGRMRPLEAFAAMTGIAAGLAEAHRHGLVHCDIKPGNLMLANSGRPKLADLGLIHPAGDTDGDESDAPSDHLGTPRYLAPECWDGAAPHPTADIWAFGATLYYLLTGNHCVPDLPKREIRRWVRNNPLPTLRPVLGELRALDDVFERCMQREPGARFQSAEELHRALTALGAEDEAVLRSPTGNPLAARAALPPNEVLGRIDTQMKRPAPVQMARRARPRTRPRPQAMPGVLIGLVVIVAVAMYAYLTRAVAS